jgi:hypothetical protein
LKEKFFICMVTLLTQRCPNKITSKQKPFWLNIFSICYRCQRQRWCTLSCEYLHEFSTKI